MPLQLHMGGGLWWRRWWRALLSELGGSALLVLLGCGLLAQGEDGSAALTRAALGWGAVVAALVTACGPASGAHLNPAVTLGAVITRALPWHAAVAYVSAQCGGALLGAAALYALVPGADGALRLPAAVHPLQGAALEAVLTGTLVLVTTGLQPADGGAPLKAGLTVAALVYVGGPWTGAALNPARALGPAALLNVWRHHWVYWLGPLGGAAAVAAARRLLAPPAAPAAPTAPLDPSLEPALPLHDKQTA